MMLRAAPLGGGRNLSWTNSLVVSFLLHAGSSANLDTDMASAFATAAAVDPKQSAKSQV